MMSSTYLLSALKKKNADLKDLVEDWWGTNDRSPSEGLKVFIELLYHSSGWIDFTFEAHGLNKCSIERYINLKEAMHQSNPECLNEIFIQRFGEFLNLLFKINDSQLLFTETFLSPVINSCSLLLKGLWTSYRIIGLVTGLKIMTRLQLSYGAILLDLKKLENSNNQEELIKKKSYISKNWKSIFLNVFKISFRDVIPEVRRISLNEMSIWVTKTPDLLLDKRWKICFYLGLRDSNSTNKNITFNILHELFKNEIDAGKQKSLFEFVKFELLYALQNMKGTPLTASISICSDIVRYAEINLNQDEDALIYICVYSESQQVAVRAAQYLIIKLIDLAESPVDLIKYIVIFNSEAKVQADSLLMDALYYFIRKEVEWKHWFELISSSDQAQILAPIKIFFAYILKAVEGHTPPMRIMFAANDPVCFHSLQSLLESAVTLMNADEESVVECIVSILIDPPLNKILMVLLLKKYGPLRVMKANMEQDKARFTKCLEQYWISLVSMDKIRRNREGLMRMIRILQYAGISLSPQVALKMAQELFTIIYANEDEYIISESTKSLQHLIFLNLTDTTAIISENVKCLTRTIMEDFLEYLVAPSCTVHSSQIHNRVLSMCRDLNFDDELLWNTTKLHLQRASTDKYSDELIITLLTILHLRLCYHLKILMNSGNEENSHDDGNSSSSPSISSVDRGDDDKSQEVFPDDSINLIKRNIVNIINSRAGVIQDYIKQFLEEPFSQSVKFTVFKMITTFIEYFGPHMMQHSKFCIITHNIDPQVEKMLMNIVKQAFQTNCSQRSLSVNLQNTSSEDCCQIVQRYCFLLGEGLIDWLNSIDLILQVKEHSKHSDFIAAAIKTFATKYPRHYIKLSIAIHNAVATAIKLDLKKQLPEEMALESGKAIIEALFINKKHDQSIRPVVLFLHQLLLSHALDTSGFKPLLKLLYYPLRHALQNEDIPVLIDIVNQYKEKYPNDLKEYSTFIERRNISENSTGSVS